MSRGFFHKGLLAFLPALFLLVGACVPAEPPPPAPGAPAAPATPPQPPFYEGKTIRFIIGWPPGGTSDIYTRLIAKYMSKYIPGNPSMVVESMPGGASLIAANHLYNVAKADGLTVGTFTAGLVLQQVLGGPGIEFDGRQFGWVGAPTPLTAMCVAMVGTGWKTMADAIGSARPIILAASAPGSVSHDTPLILQEALGINLKLVSGYGGIAPMRLAVDRGEVEGVCTSLEGFAAGWALAEAGQLVILGLAGTAPHLDQPGVPLLRDMAKTTEGRQLIDLGVTASSRLLWSYALPPKTPPERLGLLREAFLKALKDPEFLAEASKAKLDIAPLSGADIEKQLQELFVMPETLKKKLAALLLPK